MSLTSGHVDWRAGVVTSSADSLQIRMFGRGSHGSMPEASIDPVVIAASTVMRLQTIVSREVGPTDSAVVTIGVLQAGTKENVIPDDAIIKLNVRTFNEGVRKHVLASIERIVNAEAAASGAPKPPEITPLDRYSLVTNDVDATNKVADAFRQTSLTAPWSRRSPRWRARISDALERSGTFRRCTGSLAATIRRYIRRRKRMARLAPFRPITIRALHR